MNHSQSRNLRELVVIGCSVLLLLMSAGVHAVGNGEMQDELDGLQCFEVTGTASTDGVDEAFARQMAIRNGLTFAGLNHNVTVSSDQSVENFSMAREATRFTSNSKVHSYQILEEGLEEAYDQYGETLERPLHYQVKMRVCLSDAPQACDHLAGNHYQARLAIAPIAVAHSYQARDIANILPGYQSELQRRLNGAGYRNLTVVNTAAALDEQGVVMPNLSQAVLEPLRDQSGAQFMLLTVLRSVSAHSEHDSYLNRAKRFYNLAVEPDSRHIEADWYLVDLMQRTLVHQQRGGFDVHGEVYVGRNRPFGSSAFFATDTGLAFHALLEQQVSDVREALKCRTLETQIIDVRNDEYVLYLNADSGVQVGDQLAVYRRDGRPVQYQGVELGMDEQPSAFIKIKRLLPRFAVAELVAKQQTVQVGDRVKAW